MGRLIVLLSCATSSCSNYRVPRELVVPDGEELSASDDRRICPSCLHACDAVGPDGFVDVSDFALAVDELVMLAVPFVATPTTAERVAAALDTLDPATATVADVINVVRAALT